MPSGPSNIRVSNSCGVPICQCFSLTGKLFTIQKTNALIGRWAETISAFFLNVPGIWMPEDSSLYRVEQKISVKR